MLHSSVEVFTSKQVFLAINRWWMLFIAVHAVYAVYADNTFSGKIKSVLESIYSPFNIWTIKAVSGIV